MGRGAKSGIRPCWH